MSLLNFSVEITTLYNYIQGLCFSSFQSHDCGQGTVLCILQSHDLKFLIATHYTLQVAIHTISGGLHRFYYQWSVY